MSLAADAPERLQALGLRLLCRSWKCSGRGWSRLSITLLGTASPTARAAQEVRCARAACICDVCEHDSSRGIELIKPIQVRLLLYARLIQKVTAHSCCMYASLHEIWESTPHRSA